MADEIVDPYGKDYQDTLFNKLAPEIEATVKRMFPHSRGARFNAQGNILSRRLAALRTEIALDAAKRGAEITERRRQEGVDAEKVNSSRSYEQQKILAAQDAKRASEFQKRSQDSMNAYIKSRAEKDTLDRKQEFEFHNKWGWDKAALKKFGYDSSPETLPPGNSQPPSTGFLVPDEKKKRKPFDYADYTGEPRTWKDQFDSYAAGNPYIAPVRSYGGDGSSGFPPSTSTGKDFFQGSGTVNERTFTREPRKFTDYIVDTADQIGRGFSDAGHEIKKLFDWAPPVPGGASPSQQPQTAGVNGAMSAMPNEDPAMPKRGFFPSSVGSGGIRSRYGFRQAA